MSRSKIACAIGFLLVVACDDGASGDRDAAAGPADAALTDLQPSDAAPRDALPLDAAPPDASPPDAGAPDAEVPPAFTVEPQQVCPGGPGCEPIGDSTLRVGASARQISDLGFEVPLIAYLDSQDCNELQPDGCGALSDDALANCGADRICPGEVGYEGPDADGSEGDLADDERPRFDYHRDCGYDGLCAGDPDYPGPDEGEGNGIFDGLWLAGFGQNRPALGVRDPTWARTVAVEQDGTLITLTSIDAVGLFYDEILDIRELARARLAEAAPEVDVDFIFVSTTHCHEVPDTMGQWGGEFDSPVPTRTGISPRYLAYLKARAAESIVEAIVTRRPAVAEVGAIRTGIAGLMRDSRPPIVLDDTLGVLRFAEPAGRTIATLVNWGNHPEALSSRNNLITSDFAHALRAGLEEGDGEAPGLGGVAIYFQGAVGGLMTPLGVDVDGSSRPTFARADTMGRQLAAAARAALADAEALEAPRLAFATAEFLVPVENAALKLIYRLGLFARAVFDDDGVELAELDGIKGNVKTQAAVLTLGPLTLYSVPGELFPELAIGGYDGSRSFGQPLVPDDPLAPDLSAAPGPPYLHDLMPGTHRWVLGLGMDELGYMVPPYDFKLHPALPYLSEAEGDHYEETNSIGPEIVPRTQAALRALAEALTGP